MISKLRHPFCSISHFLGVLGGVAGTIVLLVLAHGRPRYVVGFAVYGCALIALYSASTLYHSLRVSPRRQEQLQRMDYVSIFLLIAGTYTPVCLITLHGALGWSMLAGEYAIGMAGILVILCWRRAPHWLRLVFYLGMGWLAALALPTLHRLLPPATMAWLVAGGVVYTVGAVVYAADRPLWPGKFDCHDLWHLFVLGGSACHFVMMVQLAGG